MQRSLPRTVAFVALGIAAAVGLAFLLEALAVHAYVADSDGATVVLEGHALAHHALLQQWSLSLDSFWTVDALWYAVAVAVAGISPVLLYAVPAVIATAVIVLGVVLATEGRRGGAAIAAGLTVVAVLAFPTHGLAYFFLRGPLHVGTALWCLVAFWCLRKGRFSWSWLVAVLFLAAGALGDFQAMALGVAPVALTGLTAWGRTRDWRRALPLLAAAASSALCYEIVRRIARAAGAFTEAAANPHSGLTQMLHDVRHGFHELVVLLGVGHGYLGLGGEPYALTYAHVVALVVLLGALAAAILVLVWCTAGGGTTVVGRRSRDPDEAFILDDSLAFAALASGAAFCLLAVGPTVEYSRYLTAAVIFASILAGRVVGRLAEAVRWRAAAVGLAGVGLAATGCYVAGVVYNLRQPAPVNPAKLLGSWLEQHHLDSGIGAYWSASIVTVESGGKVVVRPVVSADGIKLYRYERNSAAYWYSEPFHFLVYAPGAPWGGVDAETAVSTFGRPAAVYSADGYQILVWHKVLRLPQRPGAGGH